MRRGQRAFHTGRGDLEGVGLLPHRVGVVEGCGHGAGRVGDLVEAERLGRRGRVGTRVVDKAVDPDPHQSAPAGRGHGDVLDQQPEDAEGALDSGTNLVLDTH